MIMRKKKKKLNELEAAWDEVRDCFFRIQIKKARIVTVRKKDGRTFRYTVPKD